MILLLIIAHIMMIHLAILTFERTIKMIIMIDEIEYGDMKVITTMMITMRMITMISENHRINLQYLTDITIYHPRTLGDIIHGGILIAGTDNKLHNVRII